MPIRQITIVGTGLIGGSLGLALKKHGFTGRIIGCDRAPVLERARAKGAIDEGHVHPADAARERCALVDPVDDGYPRFLGGLGPRRLAVAVLTGPLGLREQALRYRRSW